MSAAPGMDSGSSVLSSAASCSGRDAIALALGGGAARGLAHVAVLEAIDELGLRPCLIAGTSMGAIIGALYAAGRSGNEIGELACDLFETRASLLHSLLVREGGTWSALLSFPRRGIMPAAAFFEAVLGPILPESFEQLGIPLSVVATDYHAQEAAVITSGPLITAVAASSALPVLLDPVLHEGRVLIDGGFVDPTPFELLTGRGFVTLASDVTGLPGGVDKPGPFEAWIGSFQIALRTIVAEKSRQSPPDLLVRPDVTAFGTFEFLRVREILAASRRCKDEVKRELDRILARNTETVA